MPAALPNTAVPYITTVHDVQEIILVGTADAGWWNDRLQTEALVAYESNTGVALMISATALVWRGMRFREYTVSVAVAEHAAPDRHAGFYLVHAFNTSRLLAWLERTLFHTPYHHGAIDLSISAPVAVTVQTQQKLLFRAQMAERATSDHQSMDMWEGPIYLPRSGATGKHKRFVAQLGGMTESYAFAPDRDTLELYPMHAPVMQALVASRFTPTEWRLRTSATHARSKTYQRSV